MSTAPNFAVTLIRMAEFDGRQHLAGSIVEVDAFTARSLVYRGVARLEPDEFQRLLRFFAAAVDVSTR